MKSIIKNSVKNMNKSMLFLSVCVILIFISNNDAYALTATQYNRFVEEGRLGNLNIEVNAKGQMFRKFGHFIIDGVYTGGDSQNPFNNEENSRDLAVLAVTEDSVYDVYGEIDYETLDYSYEDDEELNATEYDRAQFSARVDKIDYGNTLKKSTGYGKYNLRPGKNLTAFIKFAYDFYKNNSGEVRVGCKNADDLVARGLTSERICPMEELETYASKNYVSTDDTDDVNLKRIWKECAEKWEYEGSALSNTDNIFEHLQDIFMCYVYLKPGIDKIRSTVGLDTSTLGDSDYGAILSMMYERFGGRPINPTRVETSNAIPVIGTGDVLPALVDLSDTELSNMTIADKIYTCMIEVKYKNNDLKLASWLKEAEEVNGGYNILSAKDYDIYMKAYQKAFQLYGQDTANDTLLDYGCVLTPDIFESKKSFNEALNDFANTIRNHFGGSSFYNNRDNANYVARSYMMAKKMCENSQFSDITDIYACDMDVVSHTYGYDSSNIILLADTQVVQLNDSYGEDCDTDQDDINDNVEAHTPEEVDITEFLKEYCKYNKYSEEETAEMLLKNSKVVMYNYSSNPVLPDSDFDGRNDYNDGRKLDNEYNSINETNNYSNIKIKFNQDYRYFFMDSTQYYEELAEMGLILSNMASKKKKNNIYVNKSWINNNTGEHYTANNLNEYMWYLGMEHIIDHTNENVPYMLGNHDTIGLLGKVNNLERNVITLVIGENENYKDILAANYDGTLGNGSGDDIHHQGYDYYADQIYEQLVNYDSSQNADRWKKSYWITGYGTGGSVANLVAKKFIDYKHVNTNIYCYTYQAPNTIDRNNLTKRIYNTKYQSIFNIENTDDIMLNLMGDEQGWTKYGVIKRLSVGDDKSVKASWNKLTGDSYKGGTNFISNLLGGILGNMGGMVSGFASSQETIVDLNVELDRKILLLSMYAEKVKFQDNFMYQSICSLISDNFLEYIKYGSNLYASGKVSLLHAKDMTSMQKTLVNNQYTMLQPMIDKMVKENRERSIERIIGAVKKIAMFYINYIPTHNNDTIDTSATTTKALLYHKYISEVNNHPFDIYDYPDAETVTDINSPVFHTIEETAYQQLSGKKIYYYNEFRDFTTDEQNGTYNVWSNGVKTGIETKDFNNNAHYVGNDCTGFSQAVMYEIEREKGSDNPRGQNGVAGLCYGLYNHNDFAELYLGSKTDDVKDRFRNLEVALMNLGYKRYDARYMTIERLQPGDLLCSKNHVEYYVGNNYISNYYDSTSDKDTNKKSGIESIRVEGENTKTKKKIIYVNNEYVLEELLSASNKPIPAAQGTFGWGGAHNEFPAENTGGEMHFFKKSDDDKCFRLYTSWDKTDGNEYTAVWRYER